MSYVVVVCKLKHMFKFSCLFSLLLLLLFLGKDLLEDIH